MNEFKDQIAFINSADIPAPKPAMFEKAGVSPTINAALDENKTQALVVGSEVISFAAGVPASLREAVSNSSLLAQLVANNRVPDRADVEGWYNAYFDSLQRLGWGAQERTLSIHNEKGTDVEVHKAILTIAAAVFGPAATALAIITSTLTALQEVSGKNKKWLTLFKRESQKATVARFQVSVAEATTDGVMLSIMAFKLQAKSDLTQVLVFKVKMSEATLYRASAIVTLTKDLLETLKPVLAKKVQKYTLDWIESLGDLEIDQPVG